MTRINSLVVLGALPVILTTAAQSQEVAPTEAVVVEPPPQVVPAPTESVEALEAAARQAATQERFREAVELYRRLAVLQPENLDHQIAIGRFSAYAKDYPGADAAYDQVLVKQPNNVDALLGKAYLQMWQQQYVVAQSFLDRARQAAPGSAEVHLALARYYFFQTRLPEARAEVDAVLAVDPNNEDAQALSRQIVMPKPLQVQVGYEHSKLSFFGSPGILKYLNLGHIQERRRLNLGVERWSRFGDKANRFVLTGSQKVGDKLWVRGGGSLAPNAVVIPKHEATVGFGYNVLPRLILGADYRYSRLEAASVHIFAPTLEYYFGSPSWLQATYYRSWTGFRDGTPDARNGSYTLRYNYQVSEPLQLYIGAGRGRESFQTFTTPALDRLGSFTATTYLAGAKWQFVDDYWLDVYGVRQRRSNGGTERTLGLSLTTRQ